MKRLIYIFVALLLVVTPGCKKESPSATNAAKLVGQWHCIAEELNVAEDIDVYVEFMADKSFNLYQKVGQGRHRHYTGTWSVSGDVLSGVYADGSEWGSSYAMEFSGSTDMKLTAKNGSKEVMTYTRESIPAEVLEGSVVRSVVDADMMPIL
jgi:hypothetical protein